VKHLQKKISVQFLVIHFQALRPATVVRMEGVLLLMSRPHRGADDKDEPWQSSQSEHIRFAVEESSQIKLTNINYKIRLDVTLVIKQKNQNSPILGDSWMNVITNPNVSGFVCDVGGGPIRVPGLKKCTIRPGDAKKPSGVPMLDV
jgi:hypothetical protein